MSEIRNRTCSCRVPGTEQARLNGMPFPLNVVRCVRVSRHSCCEWLRLSLLRDLWDCTPSNRPNARSPSSSFNRPCGSAFNLNSLNLAQSPRTAASWRISCVHGRLMQRRSVQTCGFSCRSTRESIPAVVASCDPSIRIQLGARLGSSRPPCRCGQSTCHQSSGGARPAFLHRLGSGNAWLERVYQLHGS